MKWITIIALLAVFLSQSQNTSSQLETVDFQKAKVVIQLDPFSNEVKGSVLFDLQILKNTSSIFLDAKNLVGHQVLIEGNKVKSIYDGEKLVIEAPFHTGDVLELTVKFTSYPSKAMYHIDKDKDRLWDQVWTQGQGKYTSNWLPSIDDMNDKMIWNLSITAPVSKRVIANGKLVTVTEGKETKTWNYTMEKPMSSYLVALAAGDYQVKRDSSASGIPLEFYYYDNQESKVAPTYQHSKEIFDFLEGEIGVAYPWQNYKQVPVKDFLYSGMENTGMTIFNDEFFTDELGANDRSYVNVNAHELAHQWFGDLVTETEAKHHWLHEGFASYYALLAEENLYGNSYFQAQLFEYAEALNEQTANGNSTALLNAKANSLTFYQHGAWALHALKEEVGVLSFRESVTRYLIKNKYQNVTTASFLDVVAQVSEKDLTDFKATWLTSEVFPTAEALRILRKQPVMEQYLQLSARRISTFEESYNSYKETLQKPVETVMVKEMVAQLSIHDNDKKYELLQQAAALNDVEVNQLIVLSTPTLNDKNRELITSMLNDASYVTRESVLFLLWNDASDKRAVLESARAQWKEINSSLDMAWIVLALNSTGYTNEELLPFLVRLQAYTGSEYSTETRTAAFDYLINLDAMSQQNYTDLMNASLHHVWRFYENARGILKAQYKRENGQFFIDQSLGNFDTKSQEILKRVLGLN
ncbi:M1 family metallopeptidase [Nonlabens sp. Ci31]|uniref:M1 family metallopeptidase n=1 Tax=Nonlabens sp. Ci31 TaxID=2608253 RepID=UPI00146280AA|nr:M1 family metallopeptidase [Nonlabens sp. Ci31]QJP35793.1 M1 family metallopeptidase [Nonlabens sp. Ci31]